MMYKTETIDTVNALKAAYDKMLPMKAEYEKRLEKKLRLEFNYNSNHIEGNTLTYGQTQLLLLFDRSSGNVPIHDIEEMKAHDIALSQVKEMAKDNERPLTELFIKELNKLILVKPFWKNAISYDGTPTRKKIEIGQYKTTSNSVRLRNGEVHEYASPVDTPVLMDDLLDWYNEKKEIVHPVQLAAEFHYKFVCIHPFDDGNGRVARLIMNYILLNNNYPPVVIKSDDKENYLTALQKADAGDIFSIIEYIERQSIWSLELSIKAANGEDIDQLEDITKEIELLKKDKLTKTKTFKTPKVTFELINHINDDLWLPIIKVLNRFDDFFAESSIENYVNNIKVKKDMLISNPQLGTRSLLEMVQNKYTIFGHDLEEVNIKKTQWIKKMLSLKSAVKKIDYRISCSVELNDSNYKLIITESNTNSDSHLKIATTLFEIEHEYKTLFMSDDVTRIIKIISNHLIKEIKGRE